MNLPELQPANEFSQYELQAIMANGQLRPTWYELLFRPHKHINDVEKFFTELTDQEKIDFDSELFRNLPQIQKKHWPLSLSININPVSLQDEYFLCLLDFLLEEQRLLCSKLCFEIVETDCFSELSEHALASLKHFKSLGGLLALDDFGTGHTHWELINNDLIDVIKIASHKHNGDQKQSLLKALSAFAQQMGLTTVLEGIETDDDLIHAKSMGVSHFQGWLFNQWKLTAS